MYFDVSTVGKTDTKVGKKTNLRSRNQTLIILTIIRLNRTHTDMSYINPINQSGKIVDNTRIQRTQKDELMLDGLVATAYMALMLASSGVPSLSQEINIVCEI